jgi:ABC-type methionine transport system permease subunit
MTVDGSEIVRSIDVLVTEFTDTAALNGAYTVGGGGEGGLQFSYPHL